MMLAKNSLKSEITQCFFKVFPKHQTSIINPRLRQLQKEINSIVDRF